MLEIGCAAGGNLIPLAFRYPDAQFVGIDLSSRQIATGERHIADLGLKNLRLIELDILDFDKALGYFDFIVAHGVYSWIPPQAKQRLLAVCHDHLASDGVAYISYNTNPGWRLRGIARDMMRYHVAAVPDPHEQAARARWILALMRSALAHESTAYSRTLNEESALLEKVSDDYLIHEHLEDHNEPLYFHEFVERLAAAGMQFLCEADLQMSMPDAMFREEVCAALLRISPDFLRMEQYMDFLRNRALRQSVVIRSERAPRRSINPGIVMDLFIALTARPGNIGPDFRAPTPDSYLCRNGTSISIASPITRAALGILHRNRPEAFSFSELYAKARVLLGYSAESASTQSSGEAGVLAADLFKAYTASAIGLHIDKPLATSAISERPVAFEPARYFAGIGLKFLPNALHEPIELDPFSMNLLTLLDGSRSESVLTFEIAARSSNGAINTRETEIAAADRQKMISHQAERVRQSLGRLRDCAFLVR